MGSADALLKAREHAVHRLAVQIGDQVQFGRRRDNVASHGVGDSAGQSENETVSNSDERISMQF